MELQQLDQTEQQQERSDVDKLLRPIAVPGQSPFLNFALRQTLSSSAFLSKENFREFTKDGRYHFLTDKILPLSMREIRSGVDDEIEEDSTENDSEPVE
jgi:hypothetical protein